MKKKMLCKMVVACGVMVFLFGIYSVAVGETEPKVTTAQVTPQIVASSAHGSFMFSHIDKNGNSTIESTARKSFTTNTSGNVAGKSNTNSFNGKATEKSKDNNLNRNVTKKSTTIKRYDPYDVYDYDDPDDFADEWGEEFGDGNYDDGYDDAYDYWEEKMN